MAKASMLVAIALSSAAMFAGTRTEAATVTWDFAGGGTLGATASYTSSGINPTTISATGYLNYNTPNTFGGTTNLFGKGTKGSSSGDENGLGLANAVNDEIWQTEFVRINFTNAQSGASNFRFSMNSTTNNEQWTVYGSDSATALGSALASGIVEGPESIAGHVYDFYSFVVSSFVTKPVTVTKPATVTKPTTVTNPTPVADPALVTKPATVAKPSPDCSKVSCTPTQQAAYPTALANYNAYLTALAKYNTYVTALANYNAYLTALAKYNTYVTALANYNAYLTASANYNAYLTALANYNKHVNDNVLLHTITADMRTTGTGGSNSAPLPATLPLFASGLGLVGYFARRRKQWLAAS